METSQLLALAAGFAGLLLGTATIIASKKSRSGRTADAEAQLRELVNENASLKAALEAQIDPRSNVVDGPRISSRDIERRAEKQFRRAGVAMVPPVDYGSLAVKTSLDAYYDALKSLYYNTSTNTQILAQYATELTQTPTPTVLILDLVAFTETRRQLGIGQAGLLIEQMRKQAYEQARPRGGSILSAIGDSLVIVFRESAQAFDAAVGIAEAIRGTLPAPEVVPRIAIGSVDLQRFERLHELYAIEAATSPGMIGVAKELWHEVSPHLRGKARHRATNAPTGVQVEFLEAAI